ncbi:hypothetical protein THAOC_36050 [Thalassiosira oceanica]|uniref:Uncharacterized protein n=1 Tax=Thalassiosira oceanica TaxID=159749 RepID=K0R0U8_THAOC|nr:hypothetical protein THAOC_36050 [Thalassiosira oceanica]|eukprot:EJK45335.1 hypothetical protein THAOC_36050 [Thalassiosira oceanica]
MGCWRSSAASAAASIAWRMARGGAAANAPELALAVGMSIVRVKVGSYIRKKMVRRRRKLTRSVRNTFKWIAGRDRVEGEFSKPNNYIDCDDRYRKLAKKRLDSARVRFEAARLDVREAEADFREACREKSYVEYARPGAQIKSTV